MQIGIQVHTIEIVSDETDGGDDVNVLVLMCSNLLPFGQSCLVCGSQCC